MATLDSAGSCFFLVNVNDDDDDDVIRCYLSIPSLFSLIGIHGHGGRRHSCQAEAIHGAVAVIRRIDDAERVRDVRGRIFFGTGCYVTAGTVWQALRRAIVVSS